MTTVAPATTDDGRFRADQAACTLHIYAHGADEVLGECVTAGGERCHTFSPTYTRAATEQRWLEHAAEQAGVCWACSQPTEGWPNRAACRRCWLMEHAARCIWPRDAAPFPGDDRP